MNKLTKVIAALLLVAALLLGIYAWLLASKPPPPPPPPPTPAQSQLYPVVIATKPLAAGVPIAADALKVESFPVTPTGSFVETAAVVGKVPVVEIGTGVPVLRSQLSAGLATQIVEGERGVAISIDEAVAVGNRIKPGDFVDVFFILRRDSQEIDNGQARLLLSKKRVLAIGLNAVNEEAPQQDAAAARRGEIQARTAVLAIPTEQIAKLALAQQAGKLVLALRNPKDPEMPTEELFPEPPAVLHAKDLKPGVVPKTPEQLAVAAQLKLPANQAFAGLALPGLAASGAMAKPQQAAASRSGTAVARAPAVEVIRGGKRE